MMNIIKLIKNMLKIAKLISVDDSGVLQFATISTLGKEQKVLMLKPYGLMSNPPTSSMVALWNQQGQESNGIGMADDPNNRIFTNMAEGESALGNYLTGSSILFDENGDDILSAANDVAIGAGGDATLFAINNIALLALAGKCTVTAPVIELNGSTYNLVMWQQLQAALSAFATAFNAHRHGGGALPDTPLSIDITAAAALTLKTNG